MAHARHGFTSIPTLRTLDCGSSIGMSEIPAPWQGVALLLVDIQNDFIDGSCALSV